MATAQGRIEFTDIVTTIEAAELAGCTPTHIARLCRAGEIPCKKNGRDWLVSASAAAALRGSLPRSLGAGKKSEPAPSRKRRK
jgi:excisionase family DNA binding protein